MNKVKKKRKQKLEGGSEVENTHTQRKWESLELGGKSEMKWGGGIGGQRKTPGSANSLSLLQCSANRRKR